MVICIKYDGCVVKRAGHNQPDRFVTGAVQALKALKAAGHVLVLTSPRSNLALREDPMLDPLVASKVLPVDRQQWERSRQVHVDRYARMLQTVQDRLPGIFAAIDDGKQGPIVADLYIEPMAVKVGAGLDSKEWHEIAATWGATRYARKKQGV